MSVSRAVSAVSGKPQAHASAWHRWLCVLAVAMSGLLVGPAWAGVSVTTLETALDIDHTPEGAQCWVLAGDDESENDEGLPEDFDPARPTAELFCPECLQDPAYAANLPLRRIEQRLIPPPGEAGHYDCAGYCQRWLLRPDAPPDVALMLVRVGVPSLCGVTGWCPGRIYERRQRVWQLIDSYGANEADELCVLSQGDAGMRLWLTPLATPMQTLEIDWRY